MTGKAKLTPAERMKADRERSTAFVARDRARSRAEALAELNEREAKREAPEASPISEAMDKLLLAARDAATADEFLTALKSDEKPLHKLLEAIFGIDGQAFAFLLFGQGSQTAPRGDLRAFLEAIHQLRPGNAMEAMLSAQMVAIHFTSLTVLTSGSLDDQRVNRVVKLMGLFTRQVELLARLQGKIAQQRVIVERVDVSAGGQAAIGSFTGGAPGGHS